LEAVSASAVEKVNPVGKATVNMVPVGIVAVAVYVKLRFAGTVNAPLVVRTEVTL
jgi:hypothetical protein